MTFEEIYGGVMTLDETVLSIDNIKALCYIAPRDEEVPFPFKHRQELKLVIFKADMLREFQGDINLLGDSERFLLIVRRSFSLILFYLFIFQHSCCEFPVCFLGWKRFYGNCNSLLS